MPPIKPVHTTGAWQTLQHESEKGASADELHILRSSRPEDFVEAVIAMDKLDVRTNHVNICCAFSHVLRLLKGRVLPSML